MSDSPTDLIVEVDGHGQFVFHKRRMRLEIAAKVELRRMTEGVVLDEFTSTFLVALSDLKVLLKDPPPGWHPADLDDLDPFDPDSYEKVLAVWGAFREKERPFQGGGAGGEAPGA